VSKRYRLRLANWFVVRDEIAPATQVLDSPTAAMSFARVLVAAADDDKEHFWAVFLNTKNRYLMHTEVSVGTQSESVVHPREVLGPALREGAASVVVIHNHPSGDPTPSPEDLRLTRRLAAAAQLLQLRLLDHVIVGNGTSATVSLAERGQLAKQSRSSTRGLTRLRESEP